VIDRAGHAIRERLARHLIVPARFIVRVQQQVRMALDEPRQERRAGQRGRLRSGGQADRRQWSGRLNPFPTDDNHPPGVRRLAIEDAIRLQHGDGGLLRPSAGEREQRSTEETDESPSHGAL
jgi:hypothetical protein